MKKSPILAAAAVAITFALTGCYGPKNVGGVPSLGIVQTAPVESDKGYVEFISVSKDAPIPIYQLDEQGNEYLLASVGLKAGDTYRTKRYGTIVQNLRVSEPTGDQTFMVEDNGDRIEVPVKEGMITPVEINYDVVQDADLFRTYRMSYRVFEPVPYQEARLKSPAAQQDAHPRRATHERH